MSYMALYRKWRPDAFQEVKGQEHIVTTLKNQIKHERIGHAYLFCGTRGTGKTTIAKLMAKAVNCEHPVDGSPCNECESCKAIAAGNSINVIEIDAASNNGVDNIRQINNAVQYSPQSGKYLVYIIDEVHMLSIGAFNALLKTLEEPPEYVIFILATTESHKIPVTILSRCQRYDFKRISIETISDRLAELLDREGVEATDEALRYVARAADGSMRDALSILDQCIAFHLGEKLTYDQVLETIGAVDVEVYMNLLSLIGSKDVGGAVEVIEQAIWQGKDLMQFVNEFTVFLRNVLMLKLSPDMSVDLTSENIARIKELGANYPETQLMEYINILQETSSKLAYATVKRIVVEVAIIKMCKPQMQEGTQALEQRIAELESKLDAAMEGGIGEKQVVHVYESAPASEEQNASEGSKPLVADQSTQEQIVKNITTKYQGASLDEIKTIVRIWPILKQRMMKVSRSFLEQASVMPGDTIGTLDLVLTRSKETELAIRYFEDKENVASLEKTLAELTEREIHIGIRKLNAKEASDAHVSEWDLSMVNYSNIEIK